MTTGSDAEASVAAVLATIRERVLSERVYPAAAERRGIQGRLTVEATIAADGRLAGVRLVRSSGSSILDKAGLNLLREVFPIENPLLHSFTVVIPITYQLENHG